VGAQHYELEAKLDPELFVRIHRATILNLDHLRVAHLVWRQDGARLKKSTDVGSRYYSSTPPTVVDPVPLQPVAP
jgi:DNA-binding LytR/AlgR family response regulator